MSRVAGFLDLGNLGLRELPDELFAFDHLTSLSAVRSQAVSR